MRIEGKWVRMERKWMRRRWGRVRIEGEIWKNGSGKLLEMEGTMNENGGEYGKRGVRIEEERYEDGRENG